MRNTIRKVMMVVPVLMMSCQVSLKPKSGPVSAQASTAASAAAKAAGLAAVREARFAKRPNQEDVLAIGTRRSLPASCCAHRANTRR
jgi:hypothetical protein